MATITNKTTGIEIVFGGGTTYIKHGNVKLLKRGTNLNIYDDSDDDGNQRGQVYITIPFADVTSPVEADIDALFDTVRGYIDVASGGDVSPLTTKGDIYTYDSDNQRLPVGTDGQVLVANSGEATGLIWQDQVDNENRLTLEVQKGSSGTINAGEVVCIDGYDVGADIPTVELADATDASGMPAIGIAIDSIGIATTGTIVVSGTVDGLDTSSWSVSDNLYVSETTGELTNVKPTGTALIQKFAEVIRSHASMGVIQVFGAGRENDLPNLPAGAKWEGDTNGVPRALGVNSQASTATLTPDADANKMEVITAQAAALTIAAPTGTPVNGQTLVIRIEDNGTARALTWNAIFEVVGVTLPTTTVISKKMYIGCIYNSDDTKWDVVAVNEEA